MCLRPALIAGSLICLVLSISCTDDGPVWILGEKALHTAADIPPVANSEDPPDGTSDDCRLILSLQLEDAGAPSGRELLAAGVSAENVGHVAVACRGGCPDGRACKFHHRIDSPDPDFASTSCICDPSAVPACRLSLRWALAGNQRRVIEEIACGTPEEALACGLAGRLENDLLEITCRRRS